jgi:hypothetical protein
MSEPRRNVIDESQLLVTINRLETDGALTAADAERLRTGLPELTRQSAYVLRHLAAHLTIGVIFAFDVIPLPLGSVSRGVWVIINRVYEEVRRDRDRARVHSLAVLGISVVPFVGYFAYVLPLRSTNADAAFLYANHVSYRRWNKPLETALETKPRWLRRLVRWTTASSNDQPAPPASSENDCRANSKSP